MRLFPEPIGGAHSDYNKAAALLKKALVRNIKELEKLTGEQLKTQRYDKYRAIGKFTESK